MRSVSFLKNCTILASIAGFAAASTALAQPTESYSAEVVAPAAERGAAIAFNLTVLHNNDGESQIINAGAGALADFGGVARFKTLVDNLKTFAATFPANGAPNGVVMISSGDNYLAGPEFSVSLDAGVPFYDTLAMQQIGYDACALGNHEFDFGPDTLEDFLSGFTGTLPFLSSNLDFSAEPGLQALVGSGRIAKSIEITVNGTRVGIVGATTTDLPFISTPRDVVVNSLLPAIQDEVDALTLAGVKIIILTSHLQGLSSEAGLVPMLKDVDIVIGGGGGELLANPGTLLVTGDTPTGAVPGATGTGYPRFANDMTGKTIPIVTTRGDYRYVGRLVASFDMNGEIVTLDTISGPVRVSGIAPDAVAADPVMQATVVNPVAAGVAALASTIIGTTQVGLDGRTAEVRARETNLGNLIADSLLWQATVTAADFGAPIPDVALQNGGGIRNNSIFPVGNFSELNTFEAVPFANFVSIVRDVPPAQFKEILENAVSRVGGSGNGRFAQISGFSFKWDFAGVAQQLDAAGMVTVAGTRVKEVILNDGRVVVSNGMVVPGAPTINVATIDFLARGGDQYPFRGRPFTVLGASYQQALDNYIRGLLLGNITAIEYPVGGEQRIIRLPAMVELATVIGHWGQSYEINADLESGPGDLNLDGVVGIGDISEAITRITEQR